MTLQRRSSTAVTCVRRVTSKFVPTENISNKFHLFQFLKMLYLFQLSEWLDRYSSRSAHVCPSHHFECIDRRRCYNSSEFCDEYPECFDHSDEENCSPLCENDHVPCFSGSIECFHPVHQRCDGSMDCPNGKDELSCSYDCPGKFSCGNFTGCFDLDVRKNSIILLCQFYMN